MDDPILLVEDMAAELESVLNFLSGLTLDPSIPLHVVQAISQRATELNDKIEVFNDQVENA